MLILLRNTEIESKNEIESKKTQNEQDNPEIQEQEKLEARPRAIANFQNRHNLENSEIESKNSQNEQANSEIPEQEKSRPERSRLAPKHRK